MKKKVLIGIIALIVLIIVGYWLYWWYNTPHVISSNVNNVSIQLGTSHVLVEAKTSEVKYKNENFRIDSLKFPGKISEEEINMLINNTEIIDRKNINIKMFSGFEGVISKSSDPSVVGSKVIIMWKENKVIVVTSKSEMENMKFIAEWYGDLYEN